MQNQEEQYILKSVRFQSDKTTTTGWSATYPEDFFGRYFCLEYKTVTKVSYVFHYVTLKECG